MGATECSVLLFLLQNRISCMHITSVIPFCFPASIHSSEIIYNFPPKVSSQSSSWARLLLHCSVSSAGLARCQQSFWGGSYGRRRPLHWHRVHSLALGPTIFKPELNVLLFQLGELLPVWQKVEFLCESGDHGMWRVSVVKEPLLQSGNFRHGVNESAVSFPLLGITKSAAAAGNSWPSDKMLLTSGSVRKGCDWRRKSGIGRGAPTPSDPAGWMEALEKKEKGEKKNQKKERLKQVEQSGLRNHF